MKSLIDVCTRPISLLNFKLLIFKRFRKLIILKTIIQISIFPIFSFFTQILLIDIYNISKTALFNSCWAQIIITVINICKYFVWPLLLIVIIFIKIITVRIFLIILLFINLIHLFNVWVLSFSCDWPIISWNVFVLLIYSCWLRNIKVDLIIWLNLLIIFIILE